MSRLVSFHPLTPEQSATVRANMGLVGMVAGRCARGNSELREDLIQEGAIGLAIATQRYEPGRGVKFSVYALYWIKARVYQHLMNMRPVRVATTGNQRKLFFTLRAAQHACPEASAEELAVKLKVLPRDVVEMDRRLATRMVDVEVDDLELPHSPHRPDEEFESQVLAREIRNRLELLALGARQIQILRHRLMAEEPETLGSLGGRLGVSRERVRQIETKLRVRLREVFADLHEAGALADHAPVRAREGSEEPARVYGRGAEAPVARDEVALGGEGDGVAAGQ